MKHPTQETWMAYLYEEITPEEQRDLKQHLEGCAACREQVEDWRVTQGLLDLDIATLQRPAATLRRMGMLNRWSAVAALVVAALLLGLGFVVGHNRARTQIREVFAQEWAPQWAQFQKAWATNMTDQVKDQFDLLATTQADWLAEERQSRLEDQALLINALKTVEARRLADLEWMQASLVWVTQEAGQGFEIADSRLSALARYVLSATPPDSEEPPNP